MSQTTYVTVVASNEAYSTSWSAKYSLIMLNPETDYFLC